MSWSRKGRDLAELDMTIRGESATFLRQIFAWVSKQGLLVDEGIVPRLLL